MKIRAKKLTILSLFTTVALVLSFVEFLLPPVFSYLPGIKIGLPNIIIIFLLYEFSLKDAAAVSVLRIFLSCLLFGNTLTLMYSLAGGILSLFIMWLLKKSNKFSKIAISISGGVFHNIGQVSVAVWIMKTKEIFYYSAPLLISGIISGALVGLAAYFLIKNLNKQKNI